MTRALAIMILGAVLLAVFLVIAVQGLFVVTRLAVVDETQGLVQVREKNAKAWRPVTPGMLVRAGSTIKVGKTGRAVLKWADGSRMKLDSGTQAIYRRWQINKLTGATSASFYQLIGRTVFKLKRALRGSTKFEVRTPTVVAAVRGTTFDVEVLADKSTAISVLDGAVAVSGKGFEANLAAGQQGATAASGFDVARMSEQRRSQWGEEVGFSGPALKIDTPEDGLKTAEPFVVVTGMAEPKVEVTVNGARVLVDEEGRFMARVALKEGDNDLKVAATQDQSQTTMARSVHYANPAASMSISLSPGEREDQAVVSVSVLDSEGRPVPDGTAVSFSSSMGAIPEVARTKGGQASVILEVKGAQPGTARIASSSGRAQAEVSIEVEAPGSQPPAQAPPQEPAQPAAPAPAGAPR